MLRYMRVIAVYSLAIGREAKLRAQIGNARGLIFG